MNVLLSPLPLNKVTPLRPRLVFRAGTTRKLCQLTGDFDPEFKTATESRSASRANVRATDLGSSFEYGGRLFFLFGDTKPADPTLNADEADDCIAYTYSKDPTTPPFLEWLTDQSTGAFSPVRIVSPTWLPSFDYGGGCVPQSGFEGADGVMYIWYTQATVINGSIAKGISSILARSDDHGYSFEYVYHASYDKFYQPWAIVIDAKDWPGLPFHSGRVVLIFGTSGEFRQSDVYLACCHLEDIEDSTTVAVVIRRPQSWGYFAGFLDNAPMWSGDEADAVPLFAQLTDSGQAGIGEFSVAYLPSISKWLMLYCFPESEAHARGVYCRQADVPWGPWALVDTIQAGPLQVQEARFDGVIWTPLSGYGRYIHVKGSNDGLNVYGDSYGPPYTYGDEWGGEYASYLVARWCTVIGDKSLALRYTLSTWNPYQVIVLESMFDIEWGIG